MSELRQWTADFIQIDGHTIALKRCLESLSAVPVVLLPGITASVDFWPGVMQHSQMLLRAVSVSLPGHAPSTVPESFQSSDVCPKLLADIVRNAAEFAFPGERVVLVGWSTGGFASLATAIEHPSIVKSIVSINGFARGSWGDLLGIMQKLAVSNWGHALFQHSVKTMFNHRWLFDQVIRRLRNGNQVIDEVTGRILSTMWMDGRRNDAQAMLQLFAGLKQLDITDRLSAIRCPVQIISSERDLVILPSEGVHLHRHVVGSELIELPEAGHLFFADAMAKVMSIIATALMPSGVI